MSNQDKINKIEFVTGEENIEREPLLDQESLGQCRPCSFWHCARTTFALALWLKN